MPYRHVKQCTLEGSAVTHFLTAQNEYVVI